MSQQQPGYISTDAGVLLGKQFKGMDPVLIPQESTRDAEMLAKEHGVFIPKTHNFIHESDVNPDLAQSSAMANYEVFDGAADIPWVSDLLKMKPVNNILGLQYTEPIELPDLPTGEFRWVRTAVSEYGCLYILDNWGKNLFCVDLLNGQRSRCGPFEAESFVACFKDNVLIGTNGKDFIRSAKMEDLFPKTDKMSPKGQAGASFIKNEISAVGDFEASLGVFEKITCPKINSNYGFHASTEQCNRTQTLVFIDEALSFIEFDVVAHTYKVYKNEKELTRIISTTGIDIPEYKMFATSSFLKRKMYGVSSQWGERFIASLKWPIMLMIPSMREPKVISKAAFIDSNGYIYYNGKCTKLNGHIRPADYQGMVRIYRDVFIILDADALSWRAIRIVVQ